MKTLPSGQSNVLDKFDIGTELVNVLADEPIRIQCPIPTL